MEIEEDMATTSSTPSKQTGQERGSNITTTNTIFRSPSASGVPTFTLAMDPSPATGPMMPISPPTMTNFHFDLDSPTSHLGERNVLSSINYLENTSSLDIVLNSNSCSSLPDGLFGENKQRLTSEDSMDYLFAIKSTGVIREKNSGESSSSPHDNTKSNRLAPLESEDFESSNLSLPILTDSNQQLLLSSTALTTDDDEPPRDSSTTTSTTTTISPATVPSSKEDYTAATESAPFQKPTIDKPSSSFCPTMAAAAVVKSGSTAKAPSPSLVEASMSTTATPSSTSSSSAAPPHTTKATASSSHSHSGGASLMPKPMVGTRDEPIRPMNPCSCRRSKCLKMYCDCFATGVYCQGCTCVDCNNLPDFEDERAEARQSALVKNPQAFTNKIARRSTVAVKTVQNVGCHCKKSGCIKRYCECFEAGAVCNDKCRCVDCKNYVGSSDLQDKAASQRRWKNKPLQTEGGANAAPVKENCPQTSLPIANKEQSKPAASSMASSSSSSTKTRSKQKGGKASASGATRQVTHLPVFGPGKQSVSKLAALNVFTFLSNEDLYNAMLVSSLWESLALDDALWEQQPN